MLAVVRKIQFIILDFYGYTSHKEEDGITNILSVHVNMEGIEGDLKVSIMISFILSNRLKKIQILSCELLIFLVKFPFTMEF